MKQIINDYFFIPGYILFGSFAVLWPSMPFYFKACENLVSLMDQVKRDGKILKTNLIFDLSYAFQWKWAFKKLPNEINYPDIFRFRTIREQIETIRLMRKVYKKAFFIYLILVPLLIVAIKYANS